MTVEVSIPILRLQIRKRAMTRMENKRPKACKNDVQLPWETEIMHILQNISRNRPEHLRSGETMKKTQSQED